VDFSRSATSHASTTVEELEHPLASGAGVRSARAARRSSGPPPRCPVVVPSSGAAATTHGPAVPHSPRAAPHLDELWLLFFGELDDLKVRLRVEDGGFDEEPDERLAVVGVAKLGESLKLVEVRLALHGEDTA
jgi:hypothetical protein